MPDQVVGLAHSDDDQQLPEPVAVGQLRKPAAFRATVETIERTQRHVLFVGEAPADTAQAGLGQD